MNTAQESNMRVSKTIARIVRRFTGKKAPKQSYYHWDASNANPEQPNLPGVESVPPGDAALLVLKVYPVSICAREYNKLPASIKRYFVKGRAK